jgi:cupin fold WbuC family metalloprotein
MRICLTSNSFVAAHRHVLGDESYIVERGVLGIATFDEDLCVTSISRIAGADLRNELSPIIGVRRRVWHAVWAETEESVFVEFKNSPNSGPEYESNIHPLFVEKKTARLNYRVLSIGMSLVDNIVVGAPLP